MQRVRMEIVNNIFGGWPVINSYPDAKGSWVLYADAGAEIEKARSKGYEMGCRAAWLTTPQALEEIAKARADERERIACYFIAEAHYLGQTVIDRIRSRSVQEPAPLEKLNTDKFCRDVERYMGLAINHLVDAVNELRSRK